MLSKNLREKRCTSYICLRIGCLLIYTEWQHHGWTEDLEEEHRQEVWGGGWLHDLFLCATRHKLPAASAVVQDLQEEVPLSLSGKSGVVSLELYHRIFLLGTCADQENFSRGIQTVVWFCQEGYGVMRNIFCNFLM